MIIILQCCGIANTSDQRVFCSSISHPIVYTWMQVLEDEEFTNPRCFISPYFLVSLYSTLQRVLVTIFNLILVSLNDIDRDSTELAVEYAVRNHSIFNQFKIYLPKSHLSIQFFISLFIQSINQSVNQLTKQSLFPSFLSTFIHSFIHSFSHSFLCSFVF